MKPNAHKSTYELLLEHFNMRPVVPLTEVGPEFYGISDEQHLRKMALQKKLGGLRPFRARDSRDAPLLVKVDNLAEDLDRRSIAARD
jgi:hypothetical protein